MERGREAAWRFFQAGSVLLVLGLFLFSLGGFEFGGILSPFVLFWIFVVVLLPFRGTPGHTAVLALAVVLTLFWILQTTGFLLAPFVLALVLAYVLDPLVDRVQGRRVGRSLAIILLAVPVLVLLAVAFVLGVPALARQTGDLIQSAPEFLQRVADWLEAAQERALRIDLPLIEEEEMLTRLRSVDSAAIIAFLEERKEAIFQGAWSGVLGLGKGLGSFLSILGYVVLTPVLTFYLLRDFDKLKGRIADLLPASARAGIVEVAGEYDGLLARYLRGQVTVALLMGTITALGLLVLRFPYAILLGVLVAVFSVVPYLGLILSLVPALFIAIVSGNVLISLLKIVVVYGVSQGLEGAVVSPRIVGDSVGLHPVWVVLALAVGVKLLVVRGVHRYRQSDLYLGASGNRE